MNDLVIYDLLVILAAGLFAGLACKRLRAPVLIGYMLVGVLIGKGGLGLVRESHHDVEQLAEGGVFLLLFAIGLEFSLHELLRLGRLLLVGGIIQMSLVAAPISGALLAVGWDWRPAVMLSLALAFSSTVLVFKTLTEWGRTNTPTGRRAIGILLFQDVMLVPLLLLIPLLSGGAAPQMVDIFILGLKSVVFVSSVVLFRIVLSRWLIPLLMSHRSPELIVLAAMVVLGGVTFATHKFGLPPAVGALAAGLMLGGNRWATQFDALVMPFRETFAVVFFVCLGLLLDPAVVRDSPLQLAGVFFALIAIKAIAATLALKLTRLPWRRSVAMGLGLAHVGEFAFVLLNIAMQSKLLSNEHGQIVIAASLFSLMVSPLLMRFSLRFTQQAIVSGEGAVETASSITKGDTNYALVIGVGPIGRRIASHLETTGYEVCVLDRSPLNLYPFEQQGFHAVAGDATDDETLARASAEEAALAVISVPDDLACLEIVRKLHALNPRGEIYVRCRYQVNAREFKSLGATHVVSEEAQSGEALIQKLTQQ